MKQKQLRDFAKDEECGGSSQLHNKTQYKTAIIQSVVLGQEKKSTEQESPEISLSILGNWVCFFKKK